MKLRFSGFTKKYLESNIVTANIGNTFRNSDGSLNTSGLENFSFLKAKWVRMER